MTKKRYIEIEVYYFNELSERVQKQIKNRFMSFLKDHIKKDTLFLSNGIILDEKDLKFLGLKNFKILKEMKEVLK